MSVIDPEEVLQTRGPLAHTVVPFETDHDVPQTWLPHQGHRVCVDGPPSVPPDAPRIGRFADLGLLGEGGLAVVRRVYDPDLRRIVAIKLLRPEAQCQPELVARFAAEAQATARLQHPAIIAVFEVGTLPDGRPFYTMPVITGHTLEDAIEDAFSAAPRTYRPRDLRLLFRRVVEGMAYAHDRGVVHRDLKPSNVMVGRFGEVAVLDWGIAKVVGAAEPTDEGGVSVPDRNHTQWGRILGTPRYMAPEQATGDVHHTSPATDVYALGTLLFQVLTGRPAFDGQTTRQVIGQVLRQERAPFESPVRVQRHLRNACDRAMSLAPADRFSDASQLLDAIDSGSRRLAIAIRVGIQTGASFEQIILPLGAGMTVEVVRRRTERNVLPDLPGSTALFVVDGSRVPVRCPTGATGRAVDESHSDTVHMLGPGDSVDVEAGAKGQLRLGDVGVFFQVGALDFSPE